MPIGKLWMNGSTLRVRFIGGTPAQRATAREQAAVVDQHANLKFDFNDAPTPKFGSLSTPATAPGRTSAPTTAAFR